MTASHEPYRIDVSQEVLDDLQHRLGHTRWPAQIPGSGWAYGTDSEYLKQLVAYWQDGFDWRAVEERANRYPQFLATIDGQKIHYFYVKSKEANAKPIILMHGYPSTSLDFLGLIEPLTDPVAHGGSASDAFDVIIPSLPGYPFSGPTRESGWSSNHIADAFVTLMGELGYDEFYAQGGDWGATVGIKIALRHKENVKALHLNFVVSLGLKPEDGEPTEEEMALAASQEFYNATESAYIYMNATKPLTFAYGLVDSPVGLAALIVEKYKAWTDNHGNPEDALTKDQILATVTAYWVTETAGTAGALYYETAVDGGLFPSGDKVEVPVAAAIFPKEIYQSTRRQAEHLFNIVHWEKQSAGGHFAPAEQPELLANDIRTALREL